VKIQMSNKEKKSVTCSWLVRSWNRR